MKITNDHYIGSAGRSSLIDLELPENFNGHLLVFVHGYMGYKDWGAWNEMQRFFTEKGFGFCKFNLTHNGGTVENGIDFPDLDAFANNSYSKEKADVLFALDWLEKKFDKLPVVHHIGHSRGGGMVLLNAMDERVCSVITLAAISSVAKRFSDKTMMEAWEKEGLRYYPNQRTKQQMPHNYSQVIDFITHKDELNIEAACKRLTKPVLLIHGDEDTSILLDEGLNLASWCNTELHIVKNTDHVFGASQPWEKQELPEKLEEACVLILDFLRTHNKL